MKYLVYKLIKVIQDYIQYFINSIVYIRYKDPLVIKAWVKIRKGKLVPNNWGDDLNLFMLPLLCKKNVVVANRSLFHILFPRKNYLCIGSILGDFEDTHSEVWGSGVMSDEDSIKAKPNVVYSVRGVMTRQKMLDAGCDCPESYGDPALLLSKLYKPKITKKRYKMGIIPNHIDSRDIIDAFINMHEDCALIEMTGYKTWTDIVDCICSCDYIISSSLHGLIVSDSYGIPNTWVFFSDKILGGKFKYLDYFSSVERCEKDPVYVSGVAGLEKLYQNPLLVNTSIINFSSIIESCPFITDKELLNE